MYHRLLKTTLRIFYVHVGYTAKVSRTQNQHMLVAVIPSNLFLHISVWLMDESIHLNKAALWAHLPLTSIYYNSLEYVYEFNLNSFSLKVNFIMNQSVDPNANSRTLTSDDHAIRYCYCQHDRTIQTKSVHIQLLFIKCQDDHCCGVKK